MKTRIAFFQFGFRYGNEVYLPYSVGLLWAYARTLPDVAERYENGGFVFLRDDPDRIVAGLDAPGVAAFSTYVWNWEMSVAVARRIKARFPACLIVFGGPQVPNRVGDFFARHPYIDVLVHGEGEVTFAELLREHAGARDYARVAGLSHAGGTSAPRPRTRELDRFPSPYLTGVFDDLLKLPYDFAAVWETNRGCPYACTFCDWGSSIAQKMSTWSEARLDAEIDYFGERRIRYVYGGDANFGILPRDVHIAERLAATKARLGYPDKFRVNFAKNSNERVRAIAKILNDQRLEKGITLSVQSMDETTLTTIKRRNMKYDSLAGFLKQYRRDGIAAYTEVILGLPGETYQSFKSGLDTLMEAGAHDCVLIYRCTVLPNAEMNDPTYRAAHGIKWKRMPIFLNHTFPGSDPVQEFEDAVVETATMSEDDYRRSLVFAWAQQAFHALHLTQVVAIYARARGGVRYAEFYERLLEFAEARPDTLVGEELRATRAKIADVLDRGQTWDIVVDGFTRLTWALEEASFLRISLELDRFYAELDAFLQFLDARGVVRIEPDVRADLLTYQKSILVQPERSGGAQVIDLHHSVHSFYQSIVTGVRGDDAELRAGRFRVVIDDPYAFSGDKEQYATKILFWGRRIGKLIYPRIEEQPLKSA
jgi:2-(S-pantetheinyl)-carbapenam-3-carboxylate methyltransferase